MSHLRSDSETANVVSHNTRERRNGRDRRELIDRRCEARFGDVVERRCHSKDRRRAIGNMSID